MKEILFNYKDREARIEIIDHNRGILTWMPVADNYQVLLHSDILTCKSETHLREDEVDTIVNIFKLYFREAVDKLILQEDTKTNKEDVL